MSHCDAPSGPLYSSGQFIQRLLLLSCQGDNDPMCQE